MKLMRLLALLFALFLLTLSVGLINAGDGDEPPPRPPDNTATPAPTATAVPTEAPAPIFVSASELDATVLVDWMELLYQRVEIEKVSAPGGSRLYAIMGVTAYQSVLPGIPEGFSMAGQVNGLPDMPYPDYSLTYDWISTANGALSTVIVGIFPNSTETQQQAQILRQRYTTQRENVVGADVVQRSLAYGDEIGQIILGWVATDNYAETRTLTYELLPPDQEYLWVPTAEGMKAVEPYWGQIRPFALSYADACAETFNIQFDTDSDSTFYLQALEVKTVGDNLTAEQELIARFWVDTPGETGTPAGHWVLIENQMVDHLGLKLDRAAMMYGLVGIALGDSFISAWSLKYQINLLRPETYINRYIDPNWRPLIASPGFPEYPSGHSVVSGAAAKVLTEMFGPVAFTDDSKRRDGFEPRSFTSFEHAAREAAISRMYGGIHFRTAIENGVTQGECIGQNAITYVQLRSIPQGE